MTPLGDAMSFVDCHEPDFGMANHFHEAFVVQTLRGDVSAISLSVVWKKMMTTVRRPTAASILQI